MIPCRSWVDCWVLGAWWLLGGSREHKHTSTPSNAQHRHPAALTVASGESTTSNHVESTWPGHEFWYKREHRKTNAETARCGVPCPRTHTKEDQDRGQHK